MGIDEHGIHRGRTKGAKFAVTLTDLRHRRVYEINSTPSLRLSQLSELPVKSVNGMWSRGGMKIQIPHKLGLTQINARIVLATE